MEPLGEYDQSKYLRLARLMSFDKNLAIFRRFDDVNIMCLLGLQAEIVHLRHQFYKTNYAEKNAQQFDESFLQSREKNSNQHQKLEQLRERLVMYNRMLAEYSQMSRLQSPRHRQLDCLRNWLMDRDGGKNFQEDDVEFDTWLGEEQANPDLYVALQPGIDEDDLFTSSIMRFIGGPFHRAIGDRMKVGKVIDEGSSIMTYRDSNIVKTINFIVTIIAAVLPPLTILVLNSVDKTKVRIGLTVLFTAIFAIILAVFSKAKRVEILVATATFAAVEVVFIGSAIPSSEKAQITGNLTLLETINGSTVVGANLTSIGD
ncbi:hypothetical protein NCS56_00758500 [Fusarium sp. Ph1]|nr:hypothetical protein NCS56_00758500 [Fusarium sp. Ph1]